MSRGRKHVSQRAHAKRRIRERFGADLNREQLRELELQIQRGTFPLLRRQTNRISIYAGRIGEAPAELVYDRKRHALVTVLFPENSQPA